MKPESIEERKERLKSQADGSAMVAMVLHALLACLFGLFCIVPDTVIRVISGGMALFCIVRVFGINWALQQRYKEIEGGELDEASKY